MEKIPLSLQTLYADLVQQAHSAPEAGTVYRQTVKGIEYLYLRATVGAVRRDTFLGRADDSAAKARAGAAKEAAKGVAARRNTVRILRGQRIPAPTTTMGRVLEVIADAGLFREAVLVGTAAYQCYSPLVGVHLPAASMMTQDADLATASLALASDDGEVSFETILKRADDSFTSIPGLKKTALPSRFRNGEGFLVELLTPQLRRSDTNPMPLKQLAAGAIPLQHMGWLIDEAQPAVALYGPGVPIRVPSAARYAAHKLIIAQKRQTDGAKRRKDLAQAKALIEALEVADPWALRDVLADARSQGRDGWARPLDRSLKELNIDVPEN